ncbi:hypothetical protein HYS48_04610 [Candidatus Woesearchaeota archaeon]|nr:hypothetical protein [Candidatus Woesearchaeota archaeon]
MRGTHYKRNAGILFLLLFLSLFFAAASYAEVCPQNFPVNLPQSFSFVYEGNSILATCESYKQTGDTVTRATYKSENTGITDKDVVFFDAIFKEESYVGYEVHYAHGLIFRTEIAYKTADAEREFFEAWEALNAEDLPENVNLGSGSPEPPAEEGEAVKKGTTPIGIIAPWLAEGTEALKGGDTSTALLQHLGLTDANRLLDPKTNEPIPGLYQLPLQKGNEYVKIEGTKVTYYKEKDPFFGTDEYIFDTQGKLVGKFLSRESGARGYLKWTGSEWTNDVIPADFQPVSVRLDADGKELFEVAYGTKKGIGTFENGKFTFQDGKAKVTVEAKGDGIYLETRVEGDKKLGYTLYCPVCPGEGIAAQYANQDGNKLYNVKDGKEVLVAQINKDGLIETSFRKDGKPLVAFDPMNGYRHIYEYDDKGNLKRTTTYAVLPDGRQRIEAYEEEGIKVDYLWGTDDKGRMLIVGIKIGDGASMPLEEIQKCARNKDQCKGIDQKAAKAAIQPLKPTFFQRFRAVARGAAAGAGICNILSEFGVDCGDSMFKAYDEFMQETVIGNVLSGETSALCTQWSEGGENSVALGKGGHPAAWIAGEKVALEYPAGTGNQTVVKEYLYKITFDVETSGMLDDCKEQLISFAPELGGNLIDLNLDGKADQQDIIRVQCNSGGYSALGGDTLVRYDANDQKVVCLKFYDTGNFNRLFKMGLQEDRLCNRIADLGKERYDFTCDYCILGGDSGVREVVRDFREEATGIPSQPENKENRPQINNPVR